MGGGVNAPLKCNPKLEAEVQHVNAIRPGLGYSPEIDSNGNLQITSY